MFEKRAFSKSLYEAEKEDIHEPLYSNLCSKDLIKHQKHKTFLRNYDKIQVIKYAAMEFALKCLKLMTPTLFRVGV